ncbi:MAG TPA: hypothetical protein PKZ83_17365 [bacterium]|nr:hypothetical protein [bacterium]HQJ66580.1 hypothetical protein [bacterium]
MESPLKVKVMGIGVSLEWLIKLLMQLLGQVLDQLVPGEKMSKDLKKAVRTAYYLADEWGDDFVATTPTDLDNEALQTLKDTCTDTSKEGQFELPAAPPL